MAVTELIQEAVSRYYGEQIQKTQDLKYDACCVADYDPELLKLLTPEVLERRYGCGSPLPEALTGQTVLDLGCGAGADCFIAAQLVGPSGKVIGLDMTPAQLQIARRNVAPHMANFGYAKPNVEFVDGLIEQIPLPDASVDVVISNCVINLSTDKSKVFEEIWRVLRPGGELYIADIVADRRVPARLMEDNELWSECLVGAAYSQDLGRMMWRAGFEDVRTVSARRLADHVEGIGFESRLIRAFKLELEPTCEDYGQVAIYRGTIAGHERGWWLDQAHGFEAGRAVRVCKNTADMLKGSRFGAHFIVSEPLAHLGPFDCSAPVGEGAESMMPMAVRCC